MLHWCSENSLRISYNLELHTACSFCSSLICRRDPKVLTTCQKFHGRISPAAVHIHFSATAATICYHHLPTATFQFENSIMSKSSINNKSSIPESFVDGSDNMSSLCNAMKMISDSELGSQFVLSFFATEFKTTSAVTGMRGRLFPDHNILSDIISLVTINKFMVCSFCFPHAIHSRNLFTDCSSTRYC